MESQSVNKKRIYREWREGDTGYYKGIKGKISIDKDTPTSFKIDWHSENIPPAWTPYTLPSYLTGEGGYITYYECFTLEGKFMKVDENPSLSFLPNEQSMPFDEVEEMNKLPEKYAVKCENEEQKIILQKHFSVLLKRTVLGTKTSFFHYPEPHYQTSTYVYVQKGYTEISFDEWKKIVDFEKLEKTLKNIESIVKSTILVADAIKNASSVFKEGSTRYEKQTHKGQLEGVPNDIVERMMECQEEQGNKRDASVFEETFSQDKVRGGFDWVDTKEDSNIWGEVEKRNFQPFYDFWKKENKKEKPYIPNCIHTIEWVSESTVKELRKNTITHKINKIETKLKKLNEKREKLLERYKSLG